MRAQQQRSINQVPLFFVIRQQETEQRETKKYQESSPRPVSKALRIAAALAFLFSLCFVLGTRVLVIKSSYEVEALRDKIIANENKLIRLNYRYAALVRPSELRQRASHELNMVTPSPNLVTVVYD